MTPGDQPGVITGSVDEPARTSQDVDRAGDDKRRQGNRADRIEHHEEREEIWQRPRNQTATA
jgi:hypothetical protein